MTSQYPAFGVSPHLNPTKYCSRSPIQTTGAEIPMRMKIIAPRSISDRGLSAERIPIGSAISIQRIAPPTTSAAVTGIASPTISFTERRFAYERPSEWSTTSRLRKSAYCSCTGRSRPSWCETRATSSAVADFPAASRAGSAGSRKKRTYVMSVTPMKRTTAQRSRLMM